MDSLILLYTGSFIPVLWGIAHLFPTEKVVQGFGEISNDNRHIIMMEWITEGVALIFIGTLLALVTYIDRSSFISRIVYWASFVLLNLLSIVSLFTGFKVSMVPFKLCPFIFTGSSVFILIGIYS